MWTRATIAGLAMMAVGLVAYLAGTLIEYPGRAFSIALVMVGVTLASLGGLEGDTVR